jgi:hypothetical protein
LKRFFVLGVLALAFAAPAAADTDYTDATGEDPNSADISTIHVANSPSVGTVTFTVTLTNLPTLTDDAAILIFIDADQNAGTGQPSTGVDYLFGLDTGGWFWEKWDTTANDFVDVQGANLFVTFSNGVLNATLHTSDIGTPKAFNFFLVTVRGTDPNTPYIDSAPDDQPVYGYTLVVPPPTVVSTSATFSGAPKAGHAFVVKSLDVDLSNGTTVKATGLKCTATLGGLAVHGTGAGGCTFKLPTTAKGKRLTVRAAGSYNGLGVVKTTTFKVG